jgi:hypothetical protein
MRSARRLTVLFVIACTCNALWGCADDKRAPHAKQSPSRWRSLPLARYGKVDPAWTQVGWGGFVVEDGSLKTAPDERGLGMLLYNKEKFGDCQIRVVFKPTRPQSNSGVFVRLDDGMLRHLDEKAFAAKRDPAGKLTDESMKGMQEASEKQLGPWYAVHHGYEVQIAEGGDEYHRTGAVYSLAPAAALPPRAADGWRTMVITLKGEHVDVDLDGQHMSSFDASSKNVPPRKQWHEPDRTSRRPTHGYIGLQNHDPGDIVYFKEVSVRPLSEPR